MADPVDYDVSLDPSPVPITLTVAAYTPTPPPTKPTEFQVTVTSVPDVTAHLTPAGNFAQKIVSGVLWPIASLVAVAFKSAVRKALENKPKEVAGSKTFTTDDNITITPQLQTLGAFSEGSTQLVKITGSLTLDASGMTG